MMKNTLKVVLLASMLPMAASAASTSDQLSPWFYSAGLGVNNFEPHCEQSIMKVCGEDSPYAYDFATGYLFNEFIGAELGYRNLGRSEWTDYSNAAFDVSAHGISLGAVGFYPLANKWSLSAEAGVLLYHLENEVKFAGQPRNGENDGVAPYLGAGIGYQINDNLKLQAKYRRYEDLDAEFWNNIHMESNYYGLELSYRFGSVAAPAAPAPAPVVPAPVAARIDADNDGVYDDVDKCLNTPAGHKVDATGCTIYEYITTKHDLGSILFDNDSSVIKPGSYADLEKLANYMNKYPQYTVSIEGHASNIGTAIYNLKLSDRRADAVAAALNNKYSISSSRISSKGYGITNLLMKENTAEAHRLNRRIEAIVTGTEKRPVFK